ncbi:MAG TPA: DUF6519 domain-containing protein [Opitutaceae bacterium]|nr:DUF6519 domain-containing protein [Opitutaceae bacterium]
MATIDLSRHATDFRKKYTGVRMQQGRVLTDDDFNEQARLDAEDTRRTRIDVIGPVGSPDDGFLITNPVPRSFGTTFTTTFTIKAGTFYLGGQRLTLEADELYHLQKDWLQQGAAAGDRPSAPAGSRFDLAYLETWQQPVSAIEDSELLEVALGGPDTSARIRNLRRVRVLSGVTSGDCHEAWAALLASLSSRGTLNSEFELVPDARLRVEPIGTTGTADLCSPPVTGGYLGAENQAIRVQLVSPTECTWGFDNAAPLYRVQLGVDTSAQRRRITMLTLPKDQAHWPLANQTVELIPWSAVLANDQKISELHGHLAKVTTSYNPDDNFFDIDVAPSNDASGQPFGETWKQRTGTGGDAATLDDEGEFFYLRVWNRGSDTTSPARIPIPLGGAVDLLHTGLRVRFTGTQLRADDFWIIAARPDAPNQVVPWELGTNRRPHGVRRWLAPLAVIHWTGGAGNVGTVVNDCRETFLPLTRIRSCCTVTVGDGNESHGHFTSIQAAVNSLPERGGRVCVLPGVYEQTVRILNRHDITISGCGPRTRIVGIAPTGTNPVAPVIEIVGGYNFSLEDFAVEAFDNGAALAGLGISLLGRNNFSELTGEATSEIVNASLSGLSVSAGQRSGLRARFVRQLSVTGCEFSNRDRACLEHSVVLLADEVCFERNVIEVAAEVTAAGGTPERSGLPAPAAFFPGTNGRGGLQIEGTSDDVLIHNNLIRGGSGNGITLGSVRTSTTPGTVGPGDDDGRFGPIDLCDPTNDLDISIEVDPTDPTSRTFSTGPLENIRIVGNRILDHGGCGIAVDRFWNLDGLDEYITVIDLAIQRNLIRRCLLRAIAEPSSSLSFCIGYGGIALADVENLVIQDNIIRDCGSGPREAVCGVFVLHGEGVEITRNRILDNGFVGENTATTGGTTSAPAAVTPKRGYRGGIVIAYALAPTRVTAIDDLFNNLADRAPLQVGEPAAKIHDNIVTAPLGRALSLSALGPVTVQANQFTTRGLGNGGGFSGGFLASTVWILNLGLSNEIFFQHGAFSYLGQGQEIDPMGNMGANLDDFHVGKVMANGQVLFSDNQVNTDLLALGGSFSIAAVLIVTLDDLGFHDNQCEANTYLLDDIVLSHALLFGMSLRTTGNRFKEGIISAFLSALTVGLLANTTAHNQGTHCIFAMGGKLVDQGNTAIIGPNPLLQFLVGDDNELTCENMLKMLGAMLAGAADTGIGSVGVPPRLAIGDPIS